MAFTPVSNIFAQFHLGPYQNSIYFSYFCKFVSHICVCHYFHWEISLMVLTLSGSSVLNL